MQHPALQAGALPGNAGASRRSPNILVKEQISMKRLYKIRNGKICGVCGGVAEYFNIDPTVIRLAWLLAILPAGFGIFAYFIAAIIMPYEDQV